MKILRSSSGQTTFSVPERKRGTGAFAGLRRYALEPNRSKNFFKNWRQYHAEINKLAKDCNLRWRAKALRHSFALYHLAQFQSSERLALAMGHSTSRMVFEHYREVVTPEAAGRYWVIFAS